MSRLFDIVDTPISGLKALRRRKLLDERGFLQRIFCNEELKQIIEERRIVQVNHTYTRKEGTVRGLHFQRPPHAEMKIVSCIRGSVFDVAVDIRSDSPTFLKWHGRRLSAENGESLAIPEGFAHGFQTLESDCEMLYLHTASYCVEAEGGIDAVSDALGITWPLMISERSDRDVGLACAENFEGICL